MYRWLVVYSLVGCGRISFDPRADVASTDATILDDALSSGLLAHYPLTDDPADGAIDISGNNHHAACLTSCPTLDSTGRVSYLFNGTTDVLHRPDILTLRPTTFTISVWFQRGTSADSQAIASKTFGSQNRNSWQIVIDNANGISFCTNESATSGDCDGTSPDRIAAGTWYHVAYTHDGAEVVAYLDGVEIVRYPMGLAYDTGPNLFGADVDGGVFVSYFAGRMSDLRIYDHPLTSAEIIDLATP